MKKILSLFIVLPLLIVAACESESGRLYRPSEEVVTFQSLEQKAEFQNIQFNPSVDILFVIDDSASMERNIRNLTNNIDKFVKAFASHDQIDFHIGVLKIWDSVRYRHPTDNPEGIVPQFQINPKTGEFIVDGENNKVRNFHDKGELIPVIGGNDERFVSRNENFTEQLRNTLKSIKPKPWVKGGTDSEGNITYGTSPRFEELFSPVLSNLKSQSQDHPLHTTNKGFWRNDSHKAFIFITDADDVTPEMSYDLFDDQVKSLIGGDAKDDYSYYAVMHTSTSTCSKDEGIRGLPASQLRLTKLLALTSAKPLNICSSFGPKLAEVGNEIRERTLRKIVIPLQKVPEFFNENPDPNETKDWLEVSYGQQKIPLYNVEEWGWSWDPEHNLIIIRGIDQMEYQEGAEFSIDFTPLRLTGE